MKKALFLFAALSISTAGICQKKGFGSLDTSSISAQFRNYAKVIRYRHELLELTGPGRYTFTQDWAETVLRPDPEPLMDGNGYDKHTRIISMEAVVYDANGKEVRKLNMSDALDRKAMDGLQFYDDSRYKVLLASHSSYPYTVAFHSKIESSTTFQFPGWQVAAGSLPIMESSFTVVSEKADDFKYKLINGAPEPVKVTSEKGTSLTWSAKNIAPQEAKAAAPKGLNAFPHVRIMQKSFKYDDYTGSSEDWRSFGAFLYDLFENRQELPPAEVLKIKSLVAEAKTEREKAAIAYRYLQKSTRYVAVMFGIGGFQPMTPKEVNENGYGECKALSNYLVSMLKVLDIKAYHAIIYANSDYRVAPLLNASFPESKANHCIAMAILDGDSTWFECTSDELTPGDLADFTENRDALLLTPNGGVLVKTPVGTALKNRRTTTSNATLQESGDVLLTFNMRLRGYQNSSARGVLNNAPSNQWDKWFRERLPLPSFDVVKLDYGNYSQPDTALTLSAELLMHSYTSTAGSRLIIKPNLLGTPLPILQVDSLRKEPVWLRMPYSEEDKVVLALPKSYRLSNDPSPKVIKGPCGEYYSHATYDVASHSIVYTRRISIDRFRLPATEYEQVRKFFQQVIKADDAKLVLVKGT